MLKYTRCTDCNQYLQYLKSYKMTIQFWLIIICYSMVVVLVGWYCLLSNWLLVL